MTLEDEKGRRDYLSLVQGGRGTDQGWDDVRSQLGMKAGGANGGDGMEPRVARLEASVAHIERDIGELKTDIREMRTDIRDVRERLSRLETRVDHLPGKGFIVTSLLVTLAVVAALVTFQGQIQRLVSAGLPGTTTPATTSQ